MIYTSEAVENNNVFIIIIKIIWAFSWGWVQGLLRVRGLSSNIIGGDSSL